MRDSGCRLPPRPTTTQTKRKQFNDNAEQHRRHQKNHHKKPKLTQSQTLTLKPHIYRPDFRISNRFHPIQSQSSRKLNKKKQKKPRCNRNSTALEGNRKWVASSLDLSGCKDKIVVVSYNILGVENASNHRDLYLNVPDKFLEWDQRKELICEEINKYNADILCFQEVDRFNDLNTLLQKDGFRGVYKARTGEACDGCATFWKENLYTLLHQESIEFQSFGLRNNVAQLCVLKMKKYHTESNLDMQASKIPFTPSRSLVVGNIHVLFNPNRGDIKLGQVRLFLEKAYKLSQEWGSIPVILGGDLNSIPRSAIYQFMTSSELNLLLHDRRKISGQLGHLPMQKSFRFDNKNMDRWSDEELRLATGSERVTHLRHQLNLHSAYIGVAGSTRSRDTFGEPLATSYHSKFMGTVDYIWHTKELVPIRVLETLPIDVLRRSAGLPSEQWGSDHLALVCELGFADDSNMT